MISVNSTKAFKPSSGWEDSSRVGYREGKIDLKNFVLLFFEKIKKRDTTTKSLILAQDER